ncbi:MAG: hypothetical protein ACJ78K_02565 [Gemmatimonadaceae bacterium]
MTRNPLLLCSAAALLVGAAACDSSTEPSASRLSQSEAAQLAADIDDASANAFGNFLLGASFSVSTAPGSNSEVTVPTPISREFSFKSNCPRGGDVTIAGSTTGTADRSAGNLSLETNATRTDAACAFEAKDGSIITLTGNPNIAYHSTFNFVAWRPSGLQTQTHNGSFNWTRGTTASGTCGVDLTSVYDPSKRSVTVSGTFCGRNISVTRTRGD